MNRKKLEDRPRGFFGLVMYNGKNALNWGSLVRTANLMEVDFIATIGKRWKQEGSDTLKTTRHIPMFHFDTFDQLRQHMPENCSIVGIELDDRAKNLKNFVHPERAIYVLGAEDSGLPEEVINKCHHLIKLNGRGSMNVAVAGSIVLYHRTSL